MIGSGVWTVITGSATIVNPTDPTSTITNLSTGLNTFRWTISNGSCTASTDDVSIMSEAVPTLANAGGDQNLCTTTATLTANTPTRGTGLWTVVSGGGNLSNASSPSTTINNLPVGTTVLRWTISNGSCTASEDELTITRSASPDMALAGGDQQVCAVSTNLQGNTPTVGAGVWTIISGSATLATPTDPNTLVSNLGVGTTVLRWTISNGSCVASTDEVSIERFEAPTIANAGGDQTLCATTTTLSANTPTEGTGSWTIISGSATLDNANDPVTTVTNLGLGSTILRWTISNGSCTASSDEVTLTRQEEPTVADAGVDQVICSDQAILNANTASAGTGLWKVLVGTATFSNPNNASTQVNNLSYGDNIFEWTISNGTCTNSVSTVTITRDEPPIVSNAGGDQTLCATTTILNGNNPGTALGTWTVTSGSAVISNPNSPNTTVNNLSGGTNTFVWTISNGSCLPSVSSVNIHREMEPSLAVAGSAQTICGESTLLNATPPSEGTGTWSLVSGSGAFQNNNDPISLVSGLSPGDNVFRWTVSNGSCTSTSSTVTITRNAEPTIANAGSDQNVCSENTALNAAIPLTGTGMWTRTNGSGILSDPTSANSGVSNLSVGVNTFVWTVSNGVCSSSSATVTIIREEVPSIANAGTDQTLCTSTVTLNANTPAVGSGAWTVINGSGVITNITNANTTVTGLSPGLNTFRWSVSSSCGSTSANVNITRDEEVLLADAGVNQQVCVTTTNLQAVNPIIGTGSWTVVSGSGILDTPTDPNSGVTNLSVGDNVFRWTVGNGVCPNSSAIVTVQRLAEPSIADAGDAQTLCTSNTVLNANLPAIGTGEWTVVSGNGVFSDPNDPRTSVTGLASGINTFRWTIRNGGCTTSSSTVNILLEEEPTIADAGPDVTLCEATTTLAANTPVIGTGSWTIIEGSAVLDDPNDPNTTVSNLSLGVNRFTWTIDNGTCTASSSTVRMLRDEEPSNAVAGTNQTTCESVLTLNANTPLVGVGQWSVITGSANITNPNNPVTTVNGLSIGTNVFRWTVSNGTCASKFANVEIIRQEAPTLADAGSDQDVCTPDANLNANTPLTGIGIWTVTEGSGVITNPNNPNSTVTGLSLGKNTFKWTVQNGDCADSESFVNINREDGPGTALAGVNQVVCAETVTLNANLPTSGSGTWSIITGSSTVTDPNNPNSGVTGLSPGLNTFRWTITNSCGTTFSNVSITRDEEPTLSNAGANQQVCTASTTLNANQPTVGDGLWTVLEGGANVDNPTQYNSTVRNLSEGINRFAWTIDNGTCTVSVSTMTVTRDPLPTNANAGADQSLCNQSSLSLNGNLPATGSGEWTQVSGPNATVILNANSATSSVNGLMPGVYVFRWTIRNGVCTTSFDDVTITNADSPQSDNALMVTDLEYCSQEIPDFIEISVSNTEPGVTYELRNANGTVLNTRVSGGGTLSFGQLSSPTSTVTYDVFAIGTAQGGVRCPAVQLEDQAQITVSNCNLPQPVNIRLNTDRCTEVKINILDSLDASVIVDVLPQSNSVTRNGGIVTVSPNGIIIYEPRGNFIGVDEFSYEICNRDIPAVCGTGVIRVSIEECTNQAPVVTVDDFSGDNCRPIQGNVLRNDFDPENGALLVRTLPPTLTFGEGIFSLNSDGSFEYTPSEDFVGQDSIVYEVCDNGSGSIVKCTEGVVYFNVLACEDVFIPEGFSPNGDGVNDGFIITGAENYNRVWLRIFNRWGNIVYESQNYQNDWSGIANRGNLSGKPLPDGTYYYVADFDSGRKQYARYLTIRR